MSGSTSALGVLLFLGLLASFLPLLLLLRRGFDGERRRLKRRLRMAARNEAVRQVPRPVGTLRREEGAKGLRPLERMLGRMLPGREALNQRLQRSGSGLTLASYALFCLICTLVAALLVMVGVGLKPGPAVVLGLLPGLLVPHIAVGVLIARRQLRFLAQLPEALDVIVRGLRSGLPVIDSIGVVAQEFDDPIAGEFMAIGDAVRLGRSLEQAVRESADRMDLADFRFFAVAVAIQRETGGNLGETLQSLAAVLRGRQQLKLKIRALSSEARSGAMIVGSLPPAMLILLRLINPDYVGILFIDPRGQVLLGLAALLIVLGAVVMMQMGRIKI